MELQCSVQTYDWGKLGSSSEVAELAKICNKTLKINECTPYAELWMGTHVNGPCFIPEKNETLSDWLKHNLESLGGDVRKEFGDDLPFLFKVLSVRKALSIQAHPNKKHAEELHSSRPDLYKDPNHKPELAIALTPFQALCAFRPIEDIKRFVNDLPELQNVLGKNTVKLLLESGNSSSLSSAFKALMTRDISIIKENLDVLLHRLITLDKDVQDRLQYPLLKTLTDSFPGDVGCWCIYFLNYLVLNPGEAIFLGPNVPHAYLYGDCIECMACSDNVVRAGLTPKYIDVVTLVSMLEYESKNEKEVIFTPIIEDSYTKIWRPPVIDFAVAEITIPKNTQTPYNTILRHSASILITISGKGKVTDDVEKDICKGNVLFLKSDRQLTIQLTDNRQDLVLYQAMCNVE